MKDQIEKYGNKLKSDGSALSGSIAFAVQDDLLISAGREHLAYLAESVLARLNCLALVVAAPSLPFAEFLVRRAPFDEKSIVPLDTETRTFLHDIPFLRQAELQDPSSRIAELLANRKGIIVEGIGIIAQGALTVEQAYINYS